MVATLIRCIVDLPEYAPHSRFDPRRFARSSSLRSVDSEGQFEVLSSGSKPRPRGSGRGVIQLLNPSPNSTIRAHSAGHGLKMPP